MRIHALRMHAFGIGIGISNQRSSIWPSDGQDYLNLISNIKELLSACL